jgi:protein arginine kinase
MREMGDLGNENNELDVVLSTRVRLARNLKNIPFPVKMEKEQSKKVVSQIKGTLFDISDEKELKFSFIDINSKTTVERQAMVERHIISPDLMEYNTECGVVVNESNNISIMINEEDHLRIQCLNQSLRLKESWHTCVEIDEMLDDKLEIAYSQKYGYLTSCPTNVGTGMRTSVMMHLPALTISGYIKNILESCSKIGIVVRGIYGENTNALGNIFQISNQVTLGQTEDEIISGVGNIVSQIIAQERYLRSELYKQNTYRFEDKIFRSYGLFTNARVLPSEEAFKLLSDVRLGVYMGLIKGISEEVLDKILTLIQSANLQQYSGRLLNPEERDIRRAEIIKELIAE